MQRELRARRSRHERTESAGIAEDADPAETEQAELKPDFVGTSPSYLSDRDRPAAAELLPIAERAAPDVASQEHGDSAGAIQTTGQQRPETRLRLLAGLTTLLVIAVLASWLSFQVHRGRQAELQRQFYLQVGRQEVLNLTTIDFTSVNSDIQRVLDCAAGTFHDDFQKRSTTFADAVRQEQSKSVRTVTQAGIESLSGDGAEILIAASVKTFIAGVQEQEPRLWRMRVTVKRQGSAVKVSKVGFVQ
jgi:Mce-associated membrane protein